MKKLLCMDCFKWSVMVYQPAWRTNKPVLFRVMACNHFDTAAQCAAESQEWNPGQIITIVETT